MSDELSPITPATLSAPKTQLNSRWAIFALITLATLAAHFMALGRGFVWDDVRSIEHFRDENGLWRIFECDPFGFVRPGKTFLFSLFYVIFNETAWPYEAAGLVVVALTGIAFWGLARRWLTSQTATIVALMYVCHPFHVEASFWFSAINGTVLTLLGIWYCRLILAKNETLTPAIHLALGTLYLGALMFKEEAVVFPVMAFLMLISLGRMPSRGMFAGWFVQYLISGAFVIFGRIESAKVGQQLEWLARGSLLSASSPRNILSHFEYFIAPFWWSYNHIYDLRPFPFYSMMIVGYIALIVAGWWILKDWRLRDPARLGLVLAVLAMLPVSNVIPMGNAWFAARYLCNSGIGLLLMLGALMERYQVFNGGKGRAAAPVVLFWILACVFASNLFHTSWENTESFLIRGLAENRTSMFLSDLARMRVQQQLPEEALELADEAIQIDPNRLMGYKIRGIALYKLGRTEEALAAWRFVEEREPLNVDNCIQIAFYFDNRYEKFRSPEDWKQAVHYYQIAMSGGNANSAVACSNLGLLYMSAGMFDEALSTWEQGAMKFPFAQNIAHNLDRARKDPRAQKPTPNQ